LNREVEVEVEVDSPWDATISKDQFFELEGQHFIKYGVPRPGNYLLKMECIAPNQLARTIYEYKCIYGRPEGEDEELEKSFVQFKK
jgi:hypothetical protein